MMSSTNDDVIPSGSEGSGFEARFLAAARNDILGRGIIAGRRQPSTTSVNHLLNQGPSRSALPQESNVAFSRTSRICEETAALRGASHCVLMGLPVGAWIALMKLKNSS